MTRRFRPTLPLAWAVLFAMVAPILVVIPISFTDQSYLSLPKEGLSLSHYAKFFSDPKWTGAAVQSLLIAACVSALATALGGACAIGCWALGRRLGNLVRLLVLVPLIVPTIVQGLGLYRVFISLGLFDTYLGAILAHTVTALPYVLITTMASLATFDNRRLQAARSLGAAPWTAVRLVLLPAIRPGLIGGAIFAFVHSFDELILVLFVTSRTVHTMPKQIWEGIQYHVDPTISVVSTLLIATTVGLLAVMAMKDRAKVRAQAKVAA